MKTKLFLLTLVSVGIVCVGKKAYDACRRSSFCCKMALNRSYHRLQDHCARCGGA